MIISLNDCSRDRLGSSGGSNFELELSTIVSAGSLYKWSEHCVTVVIEHLLEWGEARVSIRYRLWIECCYWKKTHKKEWRRMIATIVFAKDQNVQEAALNGSTELKSNQEQLEMKTMSSNYNEMFVFRLRHERQNAHNVPRLLLFIWPGWVLLLSIGSYTEMSSFCFIKIRI